MDDRELKLKCLEMFVDPASKAGMEKGDVFILARRAWDFVNETTAEKPKEQPKGSKGK